MTGKIVTDGNTIAIYPDTQKRLRCAIPMVILLPGVCSASIYGMNRILDLMRIYFSYISHLPMSPPAPLLNSFYSALPWFFYIYAAVVYTTLLIIMNRKNLPALTISPEGLTLYHPISKIGVVRWDEIEQIRTIKSLSWYVGIVTRDPDRIYRRFEEDASWWMRPYVLLRRYLPLYQLFNASLPPIHIPLMYLPMSGDELVEHVNAYRHNAPTW